MTKCDDALKREASFLALLAAPARRALESKYIMTAEQLAAFIQRGTLQLHGVGPGSLPILNQTLEAYKLTFKTKN